MNKNQFMERVKRGGPIAGETEAHALLVQFNNEALRITAELNGAYHDPDKVRALFSRLTGETIDESSFIFPSFYTDFGKAYHDREDVFYNREP